MIGIYNSINKKSLIQIYNFNKCLSTLCDGTVTPLDEDQEEFFNVYTPYLSVGFREFYKSILEILSNNPAYYKVNERSPREVVLHYMSTYIQTYDKHSEDESYRFTLRIKDYNVYTILCFLENLFLCDASCVKN